MLREIVILQDIDGRPRRRETLSRCHPAVFAVTPDHRPHPFARSFPVPEEWLPDTAEPLPRRGWWKADAVALAAVQALGVQADFYWFVESDVTADPEVWKALFAAYADNDLDGLATSIGRKGHTGFRHWNHPATPEDADRHFIMALYRLSRAAVEASISMAEELRETFSEVAVPYVMKRHGLGMGEISRRFYTADTFGVKPEQIVINRRFLCHPVKEHGP